jgi:UDP-N-acetylmuramyl pentapeptide phosphotransferase/UDP-N-acetylglucosamine-1-phosphate transferase
MLVALAAFGIAWLVTWLRMRFAVLDYPEARSSHTAPTPTSGGLGIIAGMGCFLGLYQWLVMPILTVKILWILGGGLVLALVGLVDDRHGVSFLVRLAVQMSISAVVLYQVMPDADLFSLKFYLLWIMLGGFVNAYNFFDGLNGLAVATACLFCFAAFFSFTATAVLYLAFIPGFLGFLYWNLQGKIFQGDTGTLFTGFVLPLFLLLEPLDTSTAVLMMGHMLFPMLFDISLTVGYRLFKRLSITLPHRDFFFHKLHDLGLSHLAITALYGLFVTLQGASVLLLNFQDPAVLTVMYAINFFLYAAFFGTVFYLHSIKINRATSPLSSIDPPVLL